MTKLGINSFVSTALQLIKSYYALIIVCLFLGWQPSMSYAQCANIDFTAPDTNICLNQVVKFAAKNAPLGSIYNWTIGSKSFSGKNLDTVTTGFIKTGSFDVSLALTFPNGGKCNINKKGFINVFKSPSIPIIKASKTRICDINESIQLSSKAANIATWNWTVGQSLYRNASDSVSHQFIRNGYFTVTLQIIDSNGCEAIAKQDSMILVERKPSIKLSFKDTGVCDTFTLFPKPTFNLYNQTGFNYDWIFNSGIPSGSAQKNPKKVFYSVAGIHGFDLKVKSKAGCDYDYHFKDSLRIGKKKTFNIDKRSTQPCNSQQFGISVLNTSDFPNSFTWLFDGDSIKANVNGSKASVDYLKSGTYKYSILHQENGCISYYYDSNVVSLKKISADFNLDHNCNCKAPDAIKANNTSITKGITSVFYDWTVYDEQSKIVATSSIENPSLTFNKNGEYDIRLVISNGLGCSDTLLSKKAVEIKPYSLGIKVSPELACGDQDVEFDIDSACLHTFSSATWRFYDSAGNEIGSEIGQKVTHSFSQNGIYSVSLSSKTTNGCSDSIYRKNLVTVSSLKKLDFVLSDTSVCEDGIINATVIAEPKDVSLTIDWYFHQASSNKKVLAKPVVGRLNEFIFRPQNAGIYDLILVASGGAGCKDSIFKKDFLKVSGLNANIKVDNNKGCLPFSTTLRAQVSRNQHPNTPGDSKIDYSWKVQPDKNVILKNPTSANTNILIQSIGEYNVFLLVTNSSGCSQTIFEEDIFEFNFEAGFKVDTLSCQNIPIQAINGTPGFNLKHTWFSNSNKVVFHTKPSAENPEFSFTAPGTYDISLVSELPSGCKDTATKSIRIAPFAFNFNLLNPKPKCTPAQFNFSASRTNIDTFIWEFGDKNSVLTDQDDIAHVYDLSKIKPFRNNFDVSLIAMNNLGCVDTLERKQLVKVLGPNPTFSINNPLGCEPHKVFFTDSTYQVERFFFHYDDGSSVDSISFKQHSYVRRKPNSEFEIFKPYIIAADKNKCFVTYMPNDSVVVYSQPKVDFNIPSSHGCSPYTITLSNKSQYGHKYFWDFNNDGIFDDTSKSPIHTFTTGTYSINLVVENKIGCKRSLLKTNILRVTAPPVVNFYFSDSLLCPDVNLGLQDRSISPHSAVSWRWKFYDSLENLVDSAIGRDILYKFQNTGLFSVNLDVFDTNGCSASLKKNGIIKIVDKLNIIEPKIDFISVIDNSKVEISWNKLLLTGFVKNELIKNENDASPLDVFNDPFTDEYIDNEPLVTNQSISYRVKLTDRCYAPNRSSNTHKTIHLSVTRNLRPFARLSWTPYQGWDSLAYYRIFKREKGGTYTELSRVSKHDTFYIDESVCNVQYEYLVTAISYDLKQFSNSNTVHFNPKFDNPDKKLYMTLATVEQDSVKLIWEASKAFNVEYYYIDKFHEKEGWKTAWRKTLDTFLIDKDAETNLYNYQYRVWFKDFCGLKNEGSNLASTIFLDVNIENEDLVYNWNAYEQWTPNVLQYVIQQSNSPHGPFEDVHYVSTNDTNYVELARARRIDSAFYARIIALGPEPYSDSSISNVVKITPAPSLILPNAFTPNNNGTNDEFYFDGLAIRKNDSTFKLYIYNRWGEEVFRTNTFGDFWNGTFHGEKCPPGSYIYYVQFTGINNQITSRRGYITILR